MIQTMSLKDIARFRKFFFEENADLCWPWLGALDGKGYGQFRIDGKNYAAHRISYFLHYAELTDGLEIMHQCDEPLCVNPSHLSQGTHLENLQDCVIKGRQQYGENHALAKLTDEQVIKIRELHANYSYKYVEIAKMYNVTRQTIENICHRKVWKHLP